MAFRFYKRIKLMPGVRLNVSGSGTSLSVGRRGASVTFSSRGTFLNTGIPGTGIASRARIDSGVAGSARVPEAFFNQMGSRENDHLIRDIAANGRKNATVTVNELRRLMQDPRLTLHDPVSGRKYSRVQLEAILRRAETEKAVEEAQAKIDQRAKELRALLDFWLPLPEVPSLSSFENVVPTAFAATVPPPIPPDRGATERIVCLEVQAAFEARFPYWILPRFLYSGKVQSEVARRLPERLIAAERDFASELARHEREQASLRAEHEELERQRISTVRALLERDIEATHRVAATALEALEFPFDAGADVFIEVVETVVVHLRLPPIDDVVPGTFGVVLKSGEIRERFRPEEERNADYRRLVLGLGILVSSHLFANLPRTDVVRVIASVRRMKKRDSDPIDPCVFDLPVGRGSVEQFRDGDLNLNRFAAMGMVLDCDSKGLLKAIPTPSCLEGIVSSSSDQVGEQ